MDSQAGVPRGFDSESFPGLFSVQVCWPELRSAEEQVALLEVAREFVLGGQGVGK